MALLQDFLQSFRALNIDPGAGGVLVAASGGVDSMVLAHLCKQAGFAPALAHVNYQMRGDESNADELFVQQWAFEQGLLFFSTRFDTKARAAQWGTGIQETARTLRYDWLEEVRAANGFAAILTAHHANDEAETVLLRLISGAGPGNIQGIAARLGYVARPLLAFPKKRLLAYAADHDLSFREDSSNNTDAYLRNKVRHHILPAIESQFPDAVAQLCQSAQRMQATQHYYRKAIERERKALMRPVGHDLAMPVRALALRPGLSTLLHELLRPYGFTFPQMPDVAALLQAQSGKGVRSATHRILRNRDHLVLTALVTTQSGHIPVEAWPAVLPTAHGALRLEAVATPPTFPKESGTAFLNIARLEPPIILRPAQVGDYFYPFGMGMKKKKVARFLTDLKMPLQQKERVWVLESNRRIAWVCGLRTDERFKLPEGFEGECLRVEWKGQ